MTYTSQSPLYNMKTLVRKLDKFSEVTLGDKLKVYSIAYNRVSKRESEYIVNWIKYSDYKEKAIELTYRFIRRYNETIKS